MMIGVKFVRNMTSDFGKDHKNLKSLQKRQQEQQKPDGC